ncbi:SEC12-like protein 2 [Coffea arabica]|uniref:SEC12-like protein 2 n=1 Tax=Coffea arabica TaxID=13443 RepID=A0A6P6V5A5_COFAR|nr:SEC12-like protein 2 [Coffea arabica]
MGEISNSQKYGVPLYGAGWVPPCAIRSIFSKEDADSGDDSKAPPPAAEENHVVLTGGGGEGSSGIPNALLFAKFDFEANSLSDRPVARLATGEDLPYRIAVHPGGEGVICSLPKSCRLYEWAAFEKADDSTLDLRSSERALEHLEDVGQQLSLAFNNEGTLLATGGEDGKLRIFQWPAMELTLNEANAHASVKDLHFSPDGKLLVSVGSGPARVWDVTNSIAIATLQKENDEQFCFCKFSPGRDGNQFLYIIAMKDRGACILKWNTTTWRKMSSKRIVRDAVSAFDVSIDGKLLAVGTIEGNIWVLSSNSMSVQTVVKKAHLGLVTALRFSKDSRYLLSASMDSSARVTQIKDEEKNGLRLWIILLMILLAIAAYFVKNKELLPQQLDFVKRL